MADSYKVVVKNIRAITDSLESQYVRFDKAAERIVRKGGALIEGNAKRVFRARPPKTVRTSATGKTWYYSKGRAAPRPPRPTNRSGLLRDSIHTKAWKVTAGRWQSTTGPSMKYGRAVELGTRRSRKFPYMEPALKTSRKGLIEIYRKEWELALRKP